MDRAERRRLQRLIAKGVEDSKPFKLITLMTRQIVGCLRVPVGVDLSDICERWNVPFALKAHVEKTENVMKNNGRGLRQNSLVVAVTDGVRVERMTFSYLVKDVKDFEQREFFCKFVAVSFIERSTVL